MAPIKYKYHVIKCLLTVHQDQLDKLDAMLLNF